MASGRPLQKYLAKKTYNLLPWENEKMENICRNGPWTWWAVERVEPRWWERFGCCALCLMTIGEILVIMWLQLLALPFDFRWGLADNVVMIMITCLLTTDGWFWRLYTFLPLLQREEPRPVWEDAENGDIRRAGAWYFHLFHFVFVFTLYFVFLTLSGVNDDIIIRLGPKCDSARSAVSAECFRFFLSVKILLPLKSWLWFFSCGWVCK